MSGIKGAFVPCILKTKFIRNTSSTYTLEYRDVILHLIHLYTVKVGEFTNQAHLKFKSHLLNKMLYHLTSHSTKHYVINVDLNYHKIPLYVEAGEIKGNTTRVRDLEKTTVIILVNIFRMEDVKTLTNRNVVNGTDF